jgi:SAM-dependent methyltransferase
MTVSQYISKTVHYKFRGMNFTFDLSQGLFSSAGVDTGTKLLLKVLSRILDEDIAAEKSPPRRVLDAGCGAGIIGICAAAAILPLVQNGVLVRCQDRDEMARLVTLHNARQNDIPPLALEAYTEPLLADASPSEESAPSMEGEPSFEERGWDLILTNIPAKAGTPVLEDFIRRSAALLNPGGRVIMVAVNPLADFFRELISAEAELLGEETGSGHTVFVYGGRARDTGGCGILASRGMPASRHHADFFLQYPFYARAAITLTMEDIPVRLETIHGAGGFDQPGGAVLAAAKLLRHISAVRILETLNRAPLQGEAPLLIHEPGQGFFPCWLLKFLRSETLLTQEQPVVLSGRNILSLYASRHNTGTGHILPTVDLQLGREALLKAAGSGYGCIAAFPDLLPQSSLPKGTDQLAAIWDTLPGLLSEGGIFLAAFSSSDAERFDRKRPSGFSRLGSIKRHGFRALAYRYC